MATVIKLALITSTAMQNSPTAADPHAGGIRRILARPPPLTSGGSSNPSMMASTLPAPSVFRISPTSPSPLSSPWSSSASPRTQHLRPAYQQHQHHHNHNHNHMRSHVRLHMHAAAASAEDATYNAQAEALLRSLGTDDQLIVVLVGLPGCGKSTVAAKIASAPSSSSSSSSSLSSVPAADGGQEKGEVMPRQQPRRWAVVCQDVLGSRKKVYNAARAALARQQSVIIDRCNFDASQRVHWLQLAAEHRQGGAGVWARAEGTGADAPVKGDPPLLRTLCVVLPRPDDVDFCAERAFGRGDDDGVHPPGTDWSTVCRRMKRDFTQPLPDEGFDAIYVCTDESMLSGITALLGAC